MKLLEAARALCEAMPEIKEKRDSLHVKGGTGEFVYFSPAHAGCDSKHVVALREAIEEEDKERDCKHEEGSWVQEDLWQCDHCGKLVEKEDA